MGSKVRFKSLGFLVHVYHKCRKVGTNGTPYTELDHCHILTGVFLSLSLCCRSEYTSFCAFFAFSTSLLAAEVALLPAESKRWPRTSDMVVCTTLCMYACMNAVNDEL